MKFFPLIGCLVLLCATAYSQKNKDIPAFGKIDKSEIDLKECEFDKNAEAVVLFDVGKFSTNFTGGTLFSEIECHVRIKILSDKGLDQADIKIPYRSYKGEQSIRGLMAQTYNTDASGNIVISKVEKAVIYDKKIDFLLESFFSIYNFLQNITFQQVNRFVYLRSVFETVFYKTLCIAKGPHSTQGEK